MAGPGVRGKRAPTVIGLHGSGGSASQWNALADDLARDFRVLAPDLHGHGGAPAWEGAPADILAADATRIVRLVEETGSRVHLVGHSYGGTLALRLALHYPSLVASVAVYEPMPIRVLPGDNARSRAAAEVVELAANVRRELKGGGEGARMRTVHAHILAQRDSAPKLAEYGRITAPVLFLCGHTTHLSARRIAGMVAFRMPLVDIQFLPGMGHLGPITHAWAVSQRIAVFIRRQVALSFLRMGEAA